MQSELVRQRSPRSHFIRYARIFFKSDVNGFLVQLSFRYHANMQVENQQKPAELGEEDLVDYEEEDDTTTVDKPAENGKDSANK